MKQPSLRTLPFVSVFAAALTVAGCSQAPPDMTAPPPDVTVGVPVEKVVTDYNDFTGRTAAVEAVKVRARVWGYLKEIKFTEGGLVKEDDTLFEIDPRTYQTAVDQAEGRLTLAEAQLSQNEIEANRNQSLRPRGGVSQEDLERSLTAKATAAASVASAKADLARARLDLGYTKVKAPISGRISRAMVTKGNLVESGEMGGTVLTTIVSVDPIYTYFDVDDLTYLQVRHQIRQREGRSGSEVQPAVELGVVNETGYPHRGVIDFVDNQIDPGTGTLRMRGKFDNKDGSLTPGLFARVHVPLGESHKALLITDRAVDTDQGKKVVYVVNDANLVEKREVKLSKLHDGQREIVSGVKAGERVIVDGIQRAREGMPVNPK